MTDTERAARAIAATLDPDFEWEELSWRWQGLYLDAATAALGSVLVAQMEQADAAEAYDDECGAR